jgi:hypothetical protein
MAGLATSRAVRRRRLITRIDAAIEGSAPHSRARRLEDAAKARHIAATQHSAAIESELDSLTGAPLSDDEWLAAVAAIDSVGSNAAREASGNSGLKIHAILMLRAAA